MTKKIDLLSPDTSPHTLPRSGVRRVNNLPLVIAVVILTAFVLMVALVAVKRANPHVKNQTAIEEVPHHTDSAVMAAEIVAGHTSGIIMPFTHKKKDTDIALPIVAVENPDVPPLPQEKQPALGSDKKSSFAAADPDLDRIRMAKMQQFEDAIKANMHIPLPSPVSTPLASRESQDVDTAQRKFIDRNQQMHQEQSSSSSASYQAGLKRIRAVMSGHTGDSEMALLVSPSVTARGASWSLSTSVEAPLTPYVLRASAVIPGIMISGIKPSLPGQIIGQVSQDVYDTATGKYLLIPQGTRLVGVYSNQVAYGQDAVLIAWSRLIFPDGKALDIGSMPGGDSAGYAGFHDKVDNHYGRLFGSALLMSGVVAGITYSQNPSQTGAYGQTLQPTAGNVMSAALGQELGQVTTQMIAKNLNTAPSLTIRPGYRFNIIVVKDMNFTRPYQAFDY